MAFSILRQFVKCSVRVAVERSSSSSVAFKCNRLDSTKSVIDVCRCFPAAAAVNLQSLQTREHRDYSKHAKPKTSKKYDSDSDSDSDWEVLGKRGETDFWRRKMRTFHGILDVNKDGVISYDDFQLLADRFVSLGHLSEKSTVEFREVIKNIWERQWGEISPYNLITVEQYMEDMRHVLNDKARFKRAFAFLAYIFKAVDKDGSGDLILKEFILFFECLGIPEADAILAFRAIDTNGDGKVTKKEFIQHGKEFFITEDENNISKYFWGPLVEH